MSRPTTSSGPAAGIFHGLIVCAVVYGLFVGVAVAGGRSAFLACLLLVTALLHAILTGSDQAVAVETPSPSLR